MDFLDPKRKKAHRRRLLIGYLLMVVAIAMGTLILLFSAFGYWVDRKTGDVIQNGTVFVDSQPGGSNIYLNGVLQGNRTSTRLVLPGGQQYTVKLSLDGYKDWTRTFTLSGGSIERLVYPLLVPKTLATTESQLYSSAPSLMTQSPDNHWLLVQQPNQTYVFDLYDLTNLKSNPTTVTIPNGLLTDPTKPALLSVIEWSSDNHHLLLQRSFNGTNEFLMLDVSSVSSSVNINTALSVNPSSVSLRDRKGDQVYIYDGSGGTIRSGDLKTRTMSGVILSDVLSFHSFGSDIILYATKTGADAGKVNVRVRENDKATYLLKSIHESQNYLLNIAEFDGTQYYTLGSNVEDAVFVYKDPLPTLKGQQSKALLIPAVLRLTNPQFVSFSPNSQFIAVQSKNNLVVYDVQNDHQYKLTLNHVVALGDKIMWMDGYRFVLTDNNQAYIFDFDGSNEQSLVASLPNGVFFTPDNKQVVSLASSKKVTGRYALTQTSLTKK